MKRPLTEGPDRDAAGRLSRDEHSRPAARTHTLDQEILLHGLFIGTLEAPLFDWPRSKADADG